MKITKLLVNRLVSLGLDKKHLETSTFVESEVRGFLGSKLATGELNLKDAGDLSAKEDETAASQLVNKAVADATAPIMANVDALTKSMNTLVETMTKGMSFGGLGNGGNAGSAAGQTDMGAAAALLGGSPGAGNDAGEKALDGSGDLLDAGGVRLKCVSELFTKSKRAVTYEMSRNTRVAKSLNGPVMTPAGMGHRELETASELDSAISGTWFKWMINRQCKSEGRSVPRAFQMNELDKRIVQYTVNECKFIGPISHRNEEEESAETWLSGTKIFNGLHKKALLDDATSGGLEAVPIEFDAAMITTPLLQGELFPFINVQTTSRRRIEGFSIGNVTFSNTAEGTSVTPFTTTAFIAAFDTTIYPIVGAMEIGLDFQEDAPVNMGQAVSERYSEAFAGKLDDLVALGSGTGEMLGLMNTTGLATVTTANNTTGPATVGDYEGLMFGVTKQFRTQAGKRAVYLTNDVTYRRKCAIQIDPATLTTDQRRVFGMDHENYMTFGHAHKVNAGIANTAGGYFCLNRYRAYRRAGYAVRIETAGKTLTLANQSLIYVRARFGGQLELGGSGAKTVQFQT